MKRLNADAVDSAILAALADFYRSHHQLIADPIQAAQDKHEASRVHHEAELRTANAKLGETTQAIDRYLSAFERGKLDEDTIGDQLQQLRETSKQLRVRRDQLTHTLEQAPTAPDSATLQQVTDHIHKVIDSDTPNQRKALVDHVKVNAPDTLYPVFRIP